MLPQLLHPRRLHGFLQHTREKQTRCWRVCTVCSWALLEAFVKRLRKYSASRLPNARVSIFSGRRSFRPSFMACSHRGFFGAANLNRVPNMRVSTGVPRHGTCVCRLLRRFIKEGTAITLLVRKQRHRPAREVLYRDFWGRTKRADLLAAAETTADADYATLRPARRAAAAWSSPRYGPRYLRPRSESRRNPTSRLRAACHSASPAWSGSHRRRTKRPAKRIGRAECWRIQSPLPLRCPCRHTENDGSPIRHNKTVARHLPQSVRWLAPIGLNRSHEPISTEVRNGVRPPTRVKW